MAIQLHRFHQKLEKKFKNAQLNFSREINEDYVKFILPIKILDLTFNIEYKYKANDYLYLNCPIISILNNKIPLIHPNIIENNKICLGPNNEDFTVLYRLDKLHLTVQLFLNEALRSMKK